MVHRNRKLNILLIIKFNFYKILPLFSDSMDIYIDFIYFINVQQNI